MNLPDWVGPVAEYIFEVGLVNTLKIAAMALVGSTVIGILLGTLLTIRFRPTQALIRLYIEVWRGLPILVTIFIIFFLLPALSPQLRIDDRSSQRRSADALGLGAGRRGDARSRRVDPARAARGGLGARLRLGRPPRVRDPAAGAAPAPAADGRACS